jgi:hypothetical protein
MPVRVSLAVPETMLPEAVSVTPTGLMVAVNPVHFRSNVTVPAAVELMVVEPTSMENALVDWVPPNDPDAEKPSPGLNEKVVAGGKLLWVKEPLPLELSVTVNVRVGDACALPAIMKPAKAMSIPMIANFFIFLTSSVAF